MDNIQNFIIENNVLTKYIGQEPHVVIPEGVFPKKLSSARREPSMKLKFSGMSEKTEFYRKKFRSNQIITPDRFFVISVGGILFSN